MALLLRRLWLNSWSAAIDSAVQRSSNVRPLLPLMAASRCHVISSCSVPTCSCPHSLAFLQRLALPSSLSKQLTQQTRGYTTTNTEALEKVNEEITSLQSPSKIFGVVHISGRQFKITPNDLIVVNKIPADIGSQIYLEKVLLAGSENFTLIGKPILSPDVVRVKATVTEHTKTAKVIVFKKKRRTTYKRKKGHRQDVTILRINDVHLTPNLR